MLNDKLMAFWFYDIEFLILLMINFYFNNI
jgi:hypothetical protein